MNGDGTEFSNDTFVDDEYIPEEPSRKYIAQRIVFAVLSPTFRVNGANDNLVIENGRRYLPIHLAAVASSYSNNCGLDCTDRCVTSSCLEGVLLLFIISDCC